MYWFSTIYFFIVTLTIGTLIDLLVKDWQADWLEKFVMRFGVGLATMSVIGIIFNLLHIPLDYRVYLGMGILIFISAFVRNKQRFTININKFSSDIGLFWKNKNFLYAIFMLILFMVTLKMYVGGSFKYDYFEDTDPWGYTAVADFIGENKTFSAPYYSIQYNEPYPQGYQIVMGVLSQTNDSIYWTMKFFSSVIISFGILFMYYFARQFSRNEEIAVLAGFFLFSVPAWVTHFIYSHHFNVIIFVVLLYVLAQLMHPHQEIDESYVKKIRTNTEKPQLTDLLTRGNIMTSWLEIALGHLKSINGWMYIGVIIYASLLINHFTTAVHGSIFCIVFIITRLLAEKKIDMNTIMVFIGGGALSLLFYIPAFARHWWLTETQQEFGGIGLFFPVIRFVASPFGFVVMMVLIITILYIYKSRNFLKQTLESWIEIQHRGFIVWLCGLALVSILFLQPLLILDSLGTGHRDYLIRDFFSADTNNMINNPVGLGFILMSAVLGSFLFFSLQIVKLFNSANAWLAVNYAWIITAFILVLGGYLSIAIIPFRAWTFLGLFASLFAACGITTFIQSLTKNYYIFLGIMLLLVVITVPTSFIPKFKINSTIIWQDVTIGTPESRQLFAWMRNGGIPKNSVVAHLCGNSEFLSGYDMNPPLWDEVFHPKRGVKMPYFVAHPLNITHEAYTVLKNANVEYITVGASCLWQAPVPPEQEASYGFLLRQKMDEYLSDYRLTLIKKSGYEFLYKLK